LRASSGVMSISMFIFIGQTHSFAVLVSRAAHR
jgi:hypothetical protein